MQRSYDQARPLQRRRLRRRLPGGRYRFVRWRWKLLAPLVDCLGALLAWCLRPFGAGRATAAGKPVERILLIQLDHLGDAVISTSVLPALQRGFPNAAIDVLAAPWNADVFRQCPAVRRVFEQQNNRFARPARWTWPFALLGWGWRLRRRSYDLGLDLRGEFPQAALLWFAGVRRRVGWKCGGGGFFLTAAADYVHGRHEVLQRRALLDCIPEIPPNLRVEAAPEISLSQLAQDECRLLWPVATRGGQPRIVLHIGGGTPAKRWPAAHYRELLGRLSLEVDPLIAFVGSAADCATSAEILGGQVWPRVVNLVGRLSLPQLAALCVQADLVIGPDSGPVHLAAAAGAQVLVLFSGTNRAAQWRPWGPRVAIVEHAVACSPCHRTQCPWSDHPCLTQILPGRVVNEAVRLLAPGTAFEPQTPVALPLEGRLKYLGAGK